LVAFEEIAAFFESATPIKGGDWGYNTLFLMRTFVAAMIFLGIVAWFSS